MKKRINREFRQYRDLGACNPPLAHQALEAEDKIGTMLSCNIIVQDAGNGSVEIAAIDPSVSMQSVENPMLARLASEVRTKLQNVLGKGFARFSRFRECSGFALPSGSPSVALTL